MRVGRGRTRLRLHVPKQDEIIARRGSLVLVFPVLQCPCLLTDRQFDPICPTCQGTGRFYPPGTQYTTTLLLHHESSARTYAEAGTWIDGMIQASVLSTVRLSERDLVRWLDIKDVLNDEVLTRGLDEQLRFSAGVELLVVADRQRTYRPDIDYRLTLPNSVTWVPGGQSPPLAAQYSVKYQAFADYLVVDDSPRLRVEHRTPQSQEVILLRADKLGPELV